VTIEKSEPERIILTMKYKRNTRRVGFTLMEILLVIAILVVLASVGVAVYSGIKAKADNDATSLMVDELCGAIDLYQTHMNEYPESGEEGLTAMMEKPDDEKLAAKWGGPYIKKVPVDPWGEPLQYEKLDEEDGTNPYRVFSTGKDKEEGTDDDISNIENEDD
jgi:general secretion pathway protein G